MTRTPNGAYKKCLFCNTEYYVKKYLIPTSKYCSRSCQAKAVRVTITASCLICMTSFTHISSRCNTAKYCSNKCRYEAHKNKGKTEYECQHCHKKFNAPLSTKRKYCSRKCVNKASHLIFNPSFTTVRKSMIRRKMIEKCNRCAFEKEPRILGVHHKDRNRNNNDISNLEVLCPNCHSIEHLKHIVVHN